MDPTSAASAIEAQAGALGSAAKWIEQAVTGSIATSCAIVAVGVVGMLLLVGRLSVRRGVATVLGCFILFSAHEIGMGLAGAGEPAPPAIVEDAPTAPTTPNAPPPAVYDPYSGAAVPNGGMNARDLP